MNNKFSYGSFKWWIGIVTNCADPEKLGRVQVAIYGYQLADETQIQSVLDYVKSNLDSNQEKQIPEAYWASTIMPVTSSSFGGIGATHGLRPGATVFGFFVDAETAQQPMILGTIPGKSKPIIIPTPKNGNVGRPVPEINKSTASQFESEDQIDLSRLVVNEDIDRTIVNYKRNSLSKVKTAYNSHTLINSRLSSLPNTLSDLSNMVSGFGNDISSALGKDVIDKISYNLTKKLNNSLNPDLVIDRVLKRQRMQDNMAMRARLNDIVRTIGFDKCLMIRFTGQLINTLELKLADMIAGALLDLFAGLLPDIDALLLGLNEFVHEVDQEILLLEANALGIIANTVGGITDTAYGLESMISLNVDAVVQEITANLDLQMGVIMDEVIGSLGGLNNITDIQIRLNSLLDSSVGINQIVGQISGAMENGLKTFSTAADAIESIPDDIIKGYSDALSELDLTNLGC